VARAVSALDESHPPTGPIRLPLEGAVESMTAGADDHSLALEVPALPVAALLDVRVVSRPLDNVSQLAKGVNVAAQNAAVAGHPAELVPPPPDPLHPRSLSNTRPK